MDAGAFVYGRGMYEIESWPRIDPHGHRLTRCQRGALSIISSRGKLLLAHFVFVPRDGSTWYILSLGIGTITCMCVNQPRSGAVFLRLKCGVPGTRACGCGPWGG